MGLRASDEDRERTVAYLRTQQAAGRLTVDELEERSAAAFAAVDVGDLAALLADLPAPPAGPPPAAAPARKPPRIPGRIGFSARWQAPTRASVAMAELLAHVAPPMQAYGYDLTERTELRVVFERVRTPTWVVIPCVLLFPIGLFTLLIRNRERVVIELAERGDGTLLVAHGTAPLAVRKAFAGLEA
jgi:hypothetical protein